MNNRDQGSGGLTAPGPEATSASDATAPDRERRRFLGATATAAAAGAAGAASPAWGGNTFMDAMGSFFQDHYQRMTDEEITDALARIERRAKRQYGVDIVCRDTPPQEGVVFGYALNISKCQGYRDCVTACGATLLHIHTHKFSPQGVSGVAVLAESHISVHTWPEIGYGAFDVFMCGDAEPWRAVDVLKAAFGTENVHVKELRRGEGLVTETAAA